MHTTLRRIVAAFAFLAMGLVVYIIIFNPFHHSSGHSKSDSSAPGLPIKKWDLDLGYQLLSPPAIGPDGTIYVGGKDSLFAVSSEGAQKWKVPTYTVRGAPVVGPDGTIYVCSTYGFLQAFNPDGSQRWKSGWGMIGFEGGPVIGDKRLLIVANTVSDIFAFDLEDGRSPVWHLSTARGGSGTLPGTASVNERSRASPAVGPDGTIYLGRQHGLHAFDPDGTERWSLGLTSGELTDAAVDWEGTVYIGSRNNDSKLYAVGPNGEKKWDFLGRGPVVGEPALARDGTIYLSVADIIFYALKQDGSILWQVSIPGRASAGPTVASDGTVYVAVGPLGAFFQSNLLAVTPHGEIKWQFKTKGQAASPALAPDGTIYLATDSGTLYALQDSGSGLMNSAWPKFQHDSANTGHLRSPY